jgi:prepilin signal peptidase PulO-like enzyme (type II secretory pathway)
MPDYPHRGPNISRIPLEGAGGFIYALTPVLILLLGAPLILAAAIAAGAVAAPLVHWQHRSHPRALAQMLGTVALFLLGLILTLQVGSHRTFRMLAVASVAGGIAASVLIAWCSGRVQHPSIRDHGVH